MLAETSVPRRLPAGRVVGLRSFQKTGMGANKRSAFYRIMVKMVYLVYVAIIWRPVKGGLHGKSQGGHYFIYKNLDLETGSNRWFGNFPFM